MWKWRRDLSGRTSMQLGRELGKYQYPVSFLPRTNSYTLKRAVTGSGKENQVTLTGHWFLWEPYCRYLKVQLRKIGNSAPSKIENFYGRCIKDTDIAMLLVYNKDKETAVYDTKTALRSSQHAELQLPSDWQDDELIAYLSFCSADGNTIANSIRLSVSVIDTPENEIEILTEPIPKNYKTKFIIRSPQGHSDMEVQATTMRAGMFTPAPAAVIPCALRAKYAVKQKVNSLPTRY